MVPGVGSGVDGLDAGGVVDVGDGWDRGSRDIEFVDTEECFLFGSHGYLLVCSDGGDEEHVGAVNVEVEPFGKMFAENAGGEGSEGFAELDL